MQADQETFAVVVPAAGALETGAGISAFGNVLPIPGVTESGLVLGAVLPPLVLLPRFFGHTNGVSPVLGHLVVDDPVVLASGHKTGRNGRFNAVLRPVIAGYQGRAMGNEQLAIRLYHQLGQMWLVEEEV